MAATTIATMAMIKTTTTTRSITPSLSSNKPVTTKLPISLPKGLLKSSNFTTPLTSAAIAGAIFSTLSSCDAAFAAQQIADIAEGDNRGLALLLPIVPAIGWVLFNILQPAINQVSKMRSSKGVVIGLGLGGLAASGLAMAPDAAAAAAETAGSDNRGTLLLFVIAPAIGWVLFNILQPALNQINKMRN